ncbi:ankyrin repeat-containing domain protein [Xylogone sp. PMI_703]|nr:ankyrin repeat-containing domain protein [Xylogone sp. PMI_703]
MLLSSVPDDIILEILSWIQSLHSLSALCRVNRRLQSITEPVVYRQDALHSHPYSLAVSWAAEHGMMSLLQKALDYGAIIPIQAILGPLKEASKPTVFYGQTRRRWYHDCNAHPLALATRYGHDDIVKIFLERGCNPHMRDPNHFSLLSLAVISGHLGLIKTFLNLGVQQNRRGFNPHPPIQLAAFHGDEKMVELLLSECTNNLPSEQQMQEALESALKATHKPVVRQLLDYGVNLNFRFSRENMTYLPTPLEWTVENEDLDLVRLFLDKGADANFVIRKDKSALLRAVAKDNVQLVKTLVRETHRVVSTIALRWAVYYQNSTITEALLENGVSCDFEESDHLDVNSSGYSGCSFGLAEPDDFMPPLIVGISQGSASLVQTLIAYGANVNVGYDGLCGPQSTQFFGTAVQLAIAIGHQEIVDLLLEAGADINRNHPNWRFPDFSRDAWQGWTYERKR